ncbi:hypothetical protein PG993_014245 [Apiospora rasikravindrae]|uniref:Uncharacterized protein n=1 Tax=Apiospora rasikravindrae TaxID=990691 RepID=A0ABR1RNA3_9PEZI
MDNALRSPALALGLLLLVVLLHAGCFLRLWLAHRRALQPPKEHRVQRFFFIIGCVLNLIYLVAGCLLFWRAVQSDVVWTGRLWKWAVCAILFDSAYVLQFPASPIVHRFVRAPHHKSQPGLLFALCLVGLELLFLILPFLFDQRLQIAAAVWHGVWTGLWSWDRVRLLAIALQFGGTVGLCLEYHFTFLIALVVSFLLFLLQRTSAVHFENIDSSWELDPRGNGPKPAVQCAHPRKKKCISLIGPGGSGKTTLLDKHIQSPTPPDDQGTIEDMVPVTCMVDGTTEQIDVLDTGDWNMFCMVDQWVKMADICIIPFHDEASFNAIRDSNIPQGSEHKFIILFALQNHTAKETTVQDETALELARKYGLMYQREVDGPPLTQALAVLNAKMANEPGRSV